MPSLTLNPPIPLAGSTVLAVFIGTPFRTVVWTLSGPGTLTPLSGYTDASGTASAKVVPVTAGDVITVSVTAGA